MTTRCSRAALQLCRSLGLAILLAASASPLAKAASFGSVVNALASGDYEAAASSARELDGQRGGDFYSAYVVASRLVLEGRCHEAEGLIAGLIATEPSFIPTRELAFMCLRAAGRDTEADAALAAIVAILPDGPERDALRSMLDTSRAKRGPAISGYVDLVPSTNVNRQTSATDINGLIIGDDSRSAAGVSIRGGIAMTQHFLSVGAFDVSGRLSADVSVNSWNGLLSPRLTLEVPMSFAGFDGVDVAWTPLASVGYADSALSLIRLGVRTAGVIQLSQGETIGLTAALYRDEHPVSPLRDGWRVEAGAAWSVPLDPGTRITPSASLDYDKTDDPSRRVLDLSAGLALDHVTSDGLILGGQARLGWRGHSRPPPLSTGPNQTDVYVVLRAEVGHRDMVLGLGEGTGAGVTPRLYYEYTHRWSDNVFYAFDSHDVGITMKAAF